MNFPDDVLFFRNLLLQRTNILFEVAGTAPFVRWSDLGDATDIDKIFSNGVMRRRVFELAEAEFEREGSEVLGVLRDIVPQNVVSVGPGNAILETILTKRLPSIRSVTLIDVEKTFSHHHGYAKKGAGYSNLLASRDFMTNNGVASAAIHICNPTVQSLPNRQFDCLISLLSMGFHYPCDEYATYIVENCSVGGVIIIDLRRGVSDAGYSTLLSSGFAMRSVIDHKKFQRIVLQRQF